LYVGGFRLLFRKEEKPVLCRCGERLLLGEVGRAVFLALMLLVVLVMLLDVWFVGFAGFMSLVFVCLATLSLGSCSVVK
tara:strand:- start:366 stop:602 length:237 start_codon:yes stop_codon:yes gene_type:complete